MLLMGAKLRGWACSVKPTYFPAVNENSHPSIQGDQVRGLDWGRVGFFFYF